MSKILISDMPSNQLPQLRNFLAKVPQKPYRFLAGDPSEDLTSYWLSEIEESINKNSGKAFIGIEQDNIVGFVAYADLPWETGIMGKKMGAVKYLALDPDLPSKSEITGQLLEHTLEWAASSQTEFLLCKAYTDDAVAIQSLERKGFLLVDTLLDYVYDYRKQHLKDSPDDRHYPGFQIRLARPDDEDALIEISQKSFSGHFGRFHSDEMISRRQATQIYVEWMRSSVHGYADWILVAEIEDKVAGYSVWKKPSRLEQGLKNPVGHYSIAAIHPDYQGRGLFGALTLEGTKLFNGLAACVEGPTHVNNYPVQRGYEKLSWRIYDARHSFHKWLSR